MGKMRGIIDKSLEVSGSIILSAMVFVVLYQVFSRTVLGKPSTLTEEFVRFALVWLSMLASAYVVGKKGHLAVTLLSEKLKGRNQKLLELVVQILFLLFAGIIMVYGGWKAVLLTSGQISPSLSISMGYVYLSVPVSGVLMFVYSLMNVFEMFLNQEK